MLTLRKMEGIILRLFQYEAVKFGTFTLKSGIESPVYFDLRVMVSYPQLMNDISELLYQKAESGNATYARLCGVPYTALPLATCISVAHNKPMLIRRKEVKDYGTKKLIEGAYQENDLCLIVEDVVTSGSSVKETAQSLCDVGLKVKDAVVLLDRQQGGSEMLESVGIKLHSVCTMSDVLEVLTKHGKIQQDTANSVRTFLAQNTFRPPQNQLPPPAPLRKELLSYSDRSKLKDVHLVTKQLLTIMDKKNTNVALSADVTTSEELLNLAETCGPHICMLKVHIDILDDFKPEVITRLKDLSAKKNFLLFEDRKFADIGNTVKHQYRGGMYHISDWATVVTVHTLTGESIIGALKQSRTVKNSACVLLAQMSSEGNMITESYTKTCVDIGKRHSDFVMGFIATERVCDHQEFIHMTPGVQLVTGGDNLGQRYLTPADVITNRGTDVIIVGRAIYNAPRPLEAVLQFKEAGWKAYLDRMTENRSV